MINVLGQLKVESYDKWKPAFDERSTMRKEAGSKEAILFRNSDDPNDVMILFKWDNKENAQKYLESESIKKLLKNIGVDIVKITYLDEAAKTI